MMSSLLLSASWNVMDPAIASLVNADTSWPFPQYAANSSIPSSWITVESTSKQTMSADRIKLFASLALFDLSVVGAEKFIFYLHVNFLLP